VHEHIAKGNKGNMKKKLERQGCTNLGQVPEAHDECSSGVHNPFALHLANSLYLACLDLKTNTRLICELGVRGQPYEIIPGARGKRQGLRECGTREALPRCLFRKRPRERLVLLERAIRITQEPLAERHVRLDLALLAGEAVVLDAEQGVERERGLGKLVCVPDFVLGGGVVEVGSAFEVLARFEEGGWRWGGCRG
jgi:hypothetical protein